MDVSADTFFLLGAHPTRGVDPHRGANPGFVRILITGCFIPDYKGTAFSTLGKLCSQLVLDWFWILLAAHLTTDWSNHNSVESGRSNPFNWWPQCYWDFEIKEWLETDLLKPCTGSLTIPPQPTAKAIIKI